jgi:hypothetical protein
MKGLLHGHSTVLYPDILHPSENAMLLSDFDLFVKDVVRRVSQSERALSTGL